ncbi:pirin family protein [Sphingobium phenoxybenzoativorans]|uniref:Pirin family protein n=1 Tax=Sphingobium phenoxybenzoativorans TaxID=1592790 RepID=A0A975K972_9SPHN|nr:pirin family protein [Sphingobium phenoxybenzoativorans]QUT06797.1 pirin family protein [Sphingobium phenoxybenzoativorans]
MTGAILRSEPLGYPWAGTDPFLICTHHLDRYPEASDGQGIAQDKLRGRSLGSDFTGKDGYNMYHGTSVPGFPAHPHRGFETVTIALTGLIDHTDSMGSMARYGDGDVQWLTTGQGVLHCEMFPLRNAHEGNPLDFYQIWLNLPADRKMTEPAFKMLWASDIPLYRVQNAEGAIAQVKVISGAYDPQEESQPALTPPAPAPDSWASDPEKDVAIWEITLESGASLTLPPATGKGTRRTLYFHTGDRLAVAGQHQPTRRLIEVIAQMPVTLSNGGVETARIMLLQGVPINEPIVAHGPFVMNTHEQIHQAMRDFRDTRFGGWPWSSNGPVHQPGQGRFARYPGRTEIDLPPS